MGELYAVVSGKGGTGKTSVCAGIATALAEAGKRVLCVDCDVGLRNLDISLGMSDSGNLYVREAQFKATIHLGEGMKVSKPGTGGELSADGKTLTFESVTTVPDFTIVPDGDYYFPESYKDAIKDMNSPLSASWYSNTRVQLSGSDSKLTKELELTLPDATAKVWGSGCPTRATPPTASSPAPPKTWSTARMETQNGRGAATTVTPPRCRWTRTGTDLPI